jgi:hypothetical protein
MTARVKAIFCVLSILLLGCVASIHSNVTAFHEIDGDVTGYKYAFLPIEGQESNLEYRTYCNLIEKEMQKYGAIRSSLDDADYLVTLVYGIDDGREQVVSRPIFGQTGVSSSHTTGSATAYGNTAYGSATTTYTPSYGVVGTSTSSRTLYTSILRLNVFPKAAVDKGDFTPIYESEVKSEGRAGQLSRVMPSLIYARMALS